MDQIDLAITTIISHSPTKPLPLYLKNQYYLHYFTTRTNFTSHCPVLLMITLSGEHQGSYGDGTSTLLSTKSRKWSSRAAEYHATCFMNLWIFIFF